MIPLSVMKELEVYKIIKNEALSFVLVFVNAWRLGSQPRKPKTKRNSELLTTLYMLSPNMGRMIKSG